MTKHTNSLAQLSRAQSWLIKMQELAASKGGKCLSKVYVDSHTKLTWECSQGHAWDAKPNNVSNGTWCPICSKGKVNDGKRRTIIDLKNYAIKMSGLCLSDELPTAVSKVEWQCNKGHTWSATPQSVLGAKNWCPECGKVRNEERIKSLRPAQLDEMKKLAIEHGGECLSSEYLKQKSPLLWRCANGHEWSANPDSIIQGGWCPECSSRVGERICREFFEQLFGAPFPKTKPKWLISSTGFLLELDGYAESIGLAFEHHGSYHYQVVPPFTPTAESLKKRQEMDFLKQEICRKHGVKIIEIPEVPTMTKVLELKDLILRMCDQEKINVPFRGVDVNPIKAYQPIPAYQQLTELAGEINGKLISKEFINWSTPLTWECDVGHQWEASPASILYQKTWCPKCAGVVKKTIEEMRELAIKKGGECLSTQYLGARVPLSWKCSEGHNWEAAPVNITSRKSWCPYCDGQKSDRTNIAYMRKVAVERGGDCLSIAYKNSKTKLLWRCSEGHEWEAIPLNVINKGSWCPTCGNMKKGPRSHG